MSKHPPAKQPANRNNLTLIVAVVAVVAIALVFAILMTGTPSPAPANSTTVAGAIADLSPASYVSEYSESNKPHYLLDVRTPEEFASGHLANAANISVETLADNLASVPKDVPIVVYCRSGNRSAQAAQILAQNGYTAIYDLGGINDWQAAGYPIES
ncbi:MAG: rhodanese-like domain-containing protein [Chloroflexi bacterium]|nr:rhodanese-like domain-containing protein [Chloroflexota bacterium]